MRHQAAPNSRMFFTTIDQRAPLVGMLGRERVEGGAPYLLEGGKPQYSPDAFDTPHTYPLEGYVEVECLRNEFDERCWKLASEYSGVRPSRIGYVDGWCRSQPPTACIAAPPAAEPLTISSFAAEASSTPAQAPCASNRKRRAAIVIERHWLYYVDQLVTGSDVVSAEALDTKFGETIGAMNAHLIFPSTPPHRFLLRAGE